MADEKFSALVKKQREEFAQMDTNALLERLDAEKKTLWTLKFTQGKRMLTDTASLTKTRKTIARLNMYLHQLGQAGTTVEAN
ncbi:MAG: 50S ribosomal protein L29 [Armatimonadetes bacterium]|nr:50S ribosomal protein L29 [Armatimonadota bacterium]